MITVVVVMVNDGGDDDHCGVEREKQRRGAADKSHDPA